MRFINYNIKISKLEKIDTDNNENYNQPGGEENEEKTRGADLLFGKMVNQLLGTPSKTT